MRQAIKNQRNTSYPESHRKRMVTPRLDPDLANSTGATSNYHSEGNKWDDVSGTVPST